MFVNKVDLGLNNQVFKGNHYEVNDYGATVLKETYPFDPKTQYCEKRYYRVIKDDSAYSGYRVADQNDYFAAQEMKYNGTAFNPSHLKDKYGNEVYLDKNEPYAYQIVIYQKDTPNLIYQGPDSGQTIDYKYTLVIPDKTTPLVYGGALLAMPDAFYSGVREKKSNDESTPPELYLDRELQEKAEKAPSHYSTKYGGSLNGVIYALPQLAAEGTKTLFLTPFGGMDDLTGHLYGNKNLMQLAPNMGTVNTHDRFAWECFKHGIKPVYDGTFTSEALEGIHIQHALKHINDDIDEIRFFEGLSMAKDMPVVYGIIPNNDKNFRVRFVNLPFKLEQDSNGQISIKSKNPDYRADRETYIQAYDKALASDEQLAAGKPIRKYDNLLQEDELGIVNYEDTTQPFCFEMSPDDITALKKNIQTINDYNKTSENKLLLDSAEAAKILSVMTNYKFGYVTEVLKLWDAKNNLAQRRQSMSPSDEDAIMPLTGEARDKERKRLERAAFQSLDMTIAGAVYPVKRYRDSVFMNLIQALRGVKNADDIEAKIEEGKLPEEVSLTDKAIEHIRKDNYLLSETDIFDKDKITLNAVMNIPLDSLEVGENTQGVLSSTYFTNRATSEETLGKSRYELLEMGDIHLDDEHAKIYHGISELFLGEVRNFANNVIEIVNEKSEEKLLDEDNDYTEYGWYIINLYGEEIAKYAFLKAISGKIFKPEISYNGRMSYNYDEIREGTTLKALGITNSKTEYKDLLEHIQKGMKNLDSNDNQLMADSILKMIKGADTMTFKMADAMINKSGLLIDLRIDALKDLVNQDNVRNRKTSFDDAMLAVIKITSSIVNSLKTINPHMAQYGEFTDISDLMRASWGDKANDENALKSAGAEFINSDDVMAKTFNRTGLVSETGYPFFFSAITKFLAKDFTDASEDNGNINGNIRGSLDRLIKSNNPNYVRNLFSFLGNQDKPRLMHYMALDLGIFYSTLSPFDDKSGNFNKENNERARVEAMKLIAGVNSVEELPLELRMNLHNQEYFRIVSPRAVAMGSLLSTVVDESRNEAGITQEQVKYLRKALSNLVDGRYLTYGPETVHRAFKDIPALDTVDGAVNEVITIAREKYGLPGGDLKWLTDKMNEIIYKEMDNFSVISNFNWTGTNQYLSDRLKERLQYVLKGDTANYEGEPDYSKFSPYVTNLAAMLKVSVQDSGCGDEYKRPLYKALKDFAEKYDGATIASMSKPLTVVESSQDYMRKYGFAAKDFETNIDILIKEAEYLARQDGTENLFGDNTDKIKETMYDKMITPAAEKAVVATAFLSVLPGNSAMYYGDEIGMTGGEDKKDNITSTNRKSYGYLAATDSPFKTKKQDIYKKMMKSSSIKSRAGAVALRRGSVYPLDTNDPNVLAFLAQDGNGNINVALLDATGISHNNRAGVPGVSTEVEVTLPHGVYIPGDTELYNTDEKDSATYIVRKEGDLYKIKRCQSYNVDEKIKMDSNTAENRVLLLSSISTVAMAAARGKLKKVFEIYKNKGPQIVKDICRAI